MLPACDQFCVEFGGWDGIHLSNVRRLVQKDDYAAVFIEGDPKKFVELKKNYQDNPKVTSLNKFVGFEQNDCLDDLLSPLDVPMDFDFLSIDIDGNDYHVWKAVTKYRPKLVCIEFNPTIPTEVNFVQQANSEVMLGSSVTAMCELAKEKGYELVSLLPCNAFFVEARYLELFEISDNSPQALRRDTSLVTWMFIGYDGSVNLTGAKRMPFHSMDIPESKLQVLPSFIRKFPDNLSPVRSLVFRALRRWWMYRYG